MPNEICIFAGIMSLMSALVSALSVLLPYTVPQWTVEVQRDVVYTTVEGHWSEAPVGEKGTVFKLLPKTLQTQPLDLAMDIYLPVGDDAPSRPLLLMMHGGSFFVGNKAEKGQAGWCEYFASLGYVAVSIDYRLGFRASKRDVLAAEQRALEDADAALRYLLGRPDLRIDPDRIFAAGTSAGAMTALNLAFRPAGDHPHIRAVGNFWGSVHDLEVLNNSDTAILSFQSPNDPVMPYEEGYPFKTQGERAWLPMKAFSEVMYGTLAVHEEAQRLGLRAEHHPCPEPRHRLHIGDDGEYTARFYEIRDRMAEFFAAEMTR